MDAAGDGSGYLSVVVCDTSSVDDARTTAVAASRSVSRTLLIIHVRRQQPTPSWAAARFGAAAPVVSAHQ
eukprot:5195044-Pleurochrysis_carterae.AAC.1